MNKTLNLTGIEAAIFDIDGTMIANAEYHKQAFFVFCERHQIPFSEDDFRNRVSGRTNRTILPDLFGKSLTDEEITRYGDEKEAIYRELYAPFITEVSGLRQLLLTLKERGIRLGITTGANLENRQLVFDGLNLNGFFEVVVGDEHITQGKPHPEGYSKTIAALGVAPEKCIIFEDAPVGVQAALASGVKTVVAILTHHTDKELSEAAVRVDHFDQLELI